MVVKLPEGFRRDRILPEGPDDSPPVATKDQALANLAAIEGINQVLTGQTADQGTNPLIQGTGIGDIPIRQPQGGVPQGAPQGGLTPEELANPLIQQALAAGATEADIAGLRPPSTLLSPGIQPISPLSVTRLIRELQSIAPKDEEEPVGVFDSEEQAVAFIGQQADPSQWTTDFKPGIGHFARKKTGGELKDEEEQSPRNMEEMIVRALQEGDFDSAIAFDDFRKRPSSFEALQAAIDFVSSPADVFTLSAFARRAVDVGPLKPGEVRPLPKSPLLKALFDRAFGQALGQQDAFGFPQPTAGPRAPEPQQLPEPFTGGVGVQEITDAIAKSRALREGATATPQTGGGLIDPNQQFTAPGGSGVDPNRLGRLGAAPQTGGGLIDPSLGFDPDVPLDGFRRPFQATEPVGGSATADPFGSFRFPAETPQPFTDIERPTIAPQLLPPPPQERPGDVRFPIPERQFIEPQAPPSLPSLIPPGTPTGTIQFGGEDRPIPVGLESLFATPQGGVVEKPGSLLSAVGLPILSAQAQRRLLPSERAAFTRLAQEAGIPLPELERELGMARPAARRPQGGGRISSAGL